MFPILLLSRLPYFIPTAAPCSPPITSQFLVSTIMSISQHRRSTAGVLDHSDGCSPSLGLRPIRARLLVAVNTQRIHLALMRQAYRAMSSLAAEAGDKGGARAIAASSTFALPPSSSPEVRVLCQFRLSSGVQSDTLHLHLGHDTLNRPSVHEFEQVEKRVILGFVVSLLTTRMGP